MRREDPEQLLRDVGRRIAALRRARDWSQQDLATRLKISVRYLARLEAGGQNLTVHRLAWLANTFGVAVVDLFATADAADEPRRTKSAKRGGV